MAKKYKVYNAKGEYIKEILSNEELSLKENEWLKGVTCFIINKNGEILMEKRTNKGLTPGKIDLCSGHVDGNEIYTQAMIRELYEELGINIGQSMNIMSVDNLDLKFAQGTNRKNFFVQVYCLFVDEINIIPQIEEVEKYAWIQRKIAFEMIRTGKTKFPKDERYESIFAKIEELYNKYINNSTEQVHTKSYLEDR